MKRIDTSAVPARIGGLVGLVCTVAALALPTGASAQVPLPGACGNPFKNHFGPFDYRKAPADIKHMVEGAHFTPGVESMTKPSKTTFKTMAQDVGYTLHVFPNHHRALMTMTRLAQRYETDPAPGAPFTVDCYYRRGVAYAPDDPVVRGLYAQYLAARGERQRALEHLAAGVETGKDNPFTQFSLGLIYFDLGEYDRAAEAARQAQTLGLPRTELIDRLKGVGKWVEPGG